LISSRETVKKLMLESYPDSSGLKFITLTGRGRAYLQDFAHREVGGILPAFTSFDQYKAARISERLRLGELRRSEELIYLAAFLRQYGFDDAGFKAFAMLPAIRYACAFSITREEMKNQKGVREEHIERIDELFDVIGSFGDWLKGHGLFMTDLCESELLQESPANNEFFVNLPLLTPTNESFFKRIRPERKLIDIPAYSEVYLRSTPGHASSLRLLHKAGIPLESALESSLSFRELQGKAALPRYLKAEIVEFLEHGGRSGQMFILLLDESLSFYLWQTVFKDLKHLVNFSPGLPLSVSPVGARLSEFFRTVGKDAPDEFRRMKEQLASELYRHRLEYAKEELYALEAAIDFLDGLEQHHELLNEDFSQVAGLLLQQKQFFLEGDRAARVQVVGLGDATGIPYERGIVLPVNSDVFPSKIYNGPFLNFIHTPQIHNAHFEIEDLALRQFFSFGKSVDVVSVFDEARNMTPSFSFTFLKNEFGAKTIKSTIAMRVPPLRGPTPFIESSDEIREKILTHKFSFSSLGSLLTCPYGFYYNYIERVSPPAIMQDDEKTGQILGTFIHHFFKHLAAEERPLAVWESLFEKLWSESPEIAGMEGKEIFRMFVLSYLNSLVNHENEHERSLLFGSGKRSAEKSIEATFGKEVKFRLNGRIDSILERDGFYTIIDFKYKTSQQLPKKPLEELVGNTNHFDPRFQMIVYSHLLMDAEGVPADRVSGYFVNVKEEEPEKRFQMIEETDIARAASTMEKIRERIERFLELEKIEPNYMSRSCPYCLLKSLCKADDFYRKAY
jgi:hypothetical protein